MIIFATKGYMFRKMHESILELLEPIPGFQGFLNKQPLSASVPQDFWCTSDRFKLDGTH